MQEAQAKLAEALLAAQAQRSEAQAKAAEEARKREIEYIEDKKVIEASVEVVCCPYTQLLVPACSGTVLAPT